METKTYRREYVAPKINVIDIRSQGVLCASATDPFSSPDPEDVW